MDLLLLSAPLYSAHRAEALAKRHLSCQNDPSKPSAEQTWGHSTFPGDKSECPLLVHLQILFEKLLAVSRRYGVRIPLYLMTSPATHDETIAYLAEHRHFGVRPDDVIVFCQGNRRGDILLFQVINQNVPFWSTRHYWIQSRCCRRP